MSQIEEVLKRALAREKASRKAAEEILEAKSAELYEVNLKLKAANAELQTSYSKTSSQLQGVFENIVDAYVIMDLWGNILKMNNAAVDLLGFESTKDSSNLMSMVLPKELKKVQKSFKKLLNEGSLTDFKIQILTNKKDIKFVHINASIIYENEQAVGAQGIVRDITLESAYQEVVEAERQKYRNIIANMNLGLVEVNNDDEILMVNQRFVEMSGYSEKELLGSRAAELFEADKEKVIEIENKRRLDGISNSYELKIVNKMKELRYWLISGAPNYNVKGEVIGSIGIHLDITEFKNLELQKEILLKKLEKSNDELQEYAHIVSHDLKSPLRSIDALVTWLREDNKDKFDEVSFHNINLIQITLEKMEQLITDVLIYSSVTEDTDKKADVDLDELVSGLLEILYIPEHVEVSVKVKLPVVKGFKPKLQQLFQNLISNAIKFIDKEEGRVEISMKESAQYYEFSVGDNGIGIEKQFHDKIFKIFHTLNKSKESTGVGLSIVKKIVELHGGEIRLESELGKGTIFYFTLKK
ncbi:MAG: PAS domain S-box protein [Winogradskyella sp.]|uniref:PAS domain-containing sensor histidine kinase n=1 Tax=Winogradskyella sp. TaxID=1883156 RepID=UPI0025E4556A|nr:PAS domain-containing sensor histidine kinase [Winogradskyella sp.]NRB82832.1 PAS domain S-box protein [Winogradskyella sp.]